MQWGEVYLAMKQGTIDGLELPAFTVTSDKFHEITKYYSMTRHSYPPDRLDHGQREVRGAARRPQEGHRRVHAARRAPSTARTRSSRRSEAFDLMKAKGVQINEVKDIREFQDRAQPVWKFLEGKVGKEFFDRVVAEAQAAAK